MDIISDNGYGYGIWLVPKSEVGSFVVNSALRFGYQTGKVSPLKPNKYVARAILK